MKATNLPKYMELKLWLTIMTPTATHASLNSKTFQSTILGESTSKFVIALMPSLPNAPKLISNSSLSPLFWNLWSQMSQNLEQPHARLYQQWQSTSVKRSRNPNYCQTLKNWQVIPSTMWKVHFAWFSGVIQEYCESLRYSQYWPDELMVTSHNFRLHQRSKQRNFFRCDEELWLSVCQDKQINFRRQNHQTFAPTTTDW